LRYPLFTKTKGNTAMPPLTETQRYQIEHDVRLGMSNARIATGIGCSCRTIEYEVGRCGSRTRAQHHWAVAWRGARKRILGRDEPKTFRRPAQCRLNKTQGLARLSDLKFPESSARYAVLC